MLNNVWRESEDSFLRLFCKVKRNKVSDYYVWSEGLIWPKFTFMRLHSPEKLTLKNFQSDLLEFSRWSGVKVEDRVIKINDKHNLLKSIKKNLEPTGSRLAYLSFTQSIKRPLLGCDLVEVSNEDDLKVFWKINSSGRIRKNPFESPLWPVVHSSYYAGTKYFYLRCNGEPVAGAAIDDFSQGLNLWGIATLEGKQGNGYMGEIVRLLAKNANKQIYVQVNYGEVSHQHFLRSCLATEIATESWFKYI
ncbi:MAG: hypothetical protein R3A80_07565 [Bdellovibrionota bacterium]